VSVYTEALGGGVKGLRIGVVREGFGHPSSEADVDAKVKAGADLFRKLGATVDDISVPMHLVAPAIWLPIAAEGATEFMMKGNGMGTNWRGLYNTTLLDAHSGWKHRADELSDSLKITMLLGQYFTKHYRGHFYAKAQNLNRKLRAAYDTALAKYDLLLMPTLPMKATPIPPPDAPRELYIQRAFEMVPNTAPFNASGHPAMSLPCGMSDGLPIGLMLIGKYFDEPTIYRAAAAFEGAGDWTKM
jgi:amidase